MYATCWPFSTSCENRVNIVPRRFERQFAKLNVSLEYLAPNRKTERKTARKIDERTRLLAC